MNFARGIVALLLALFALPSATWAADRAAFSVVGYSPDGRYFAFEEYGVHDGSGFAFSTIYLIDLPADSFVTGSPYRAAADDQHDSLTVAEVRGMAQQAAATALKSYKVTSGGEIWVMLGDGVEKADGRTLVWSIPNCCNPGATQEGVLKLDLTTFPMATTPECDSLISRAPMGFALRVTDSSGGSKEVHRDTSLPKSRGCTDDYRLYAVVAPLDGNGGEVAIVSSYPFGFEGDDRRFIAVPLGELY